MLRECVANRPCHSVLLALKVVRNAKTSLKLIGIRAILKPRIFKFRENQIREIQEVPVLSKKIGVF